MPNIDMSWSVPQVIRNPDGTVTYKKVKKKPIIRPKSQRLEKSDSGAKIVYIHRKILDNPVLSSQFSKAISDKIINNQKIGLVVRKDAANCKKHLWQPFMTPIVEASLKKGLKLEVYSEHPTIHTIFKTIFPDNFGPFKENRGLLYFTL